MGKGRGPRAGGLLAGRGRESEKDPEKETQEDREWEGGQTECGVLSQCHTQDVIQEGSDCL